MRKRIVIKGLVQGVGFRPFVYRLATELSLSGWVGNTMQGVEIEVEGSPENLDSFLKRLKNAAPPSARLDQIKVTNTKPQQDRTFTILPSDADGAPSALILPDLATCPECREEIFDPSNRRFRYPFTNCTNCGPRFSIIEKLPYDRSHTTMKAFQMCPACLREYRNPQDRRFHAQPNACPECGPQLELWDRQGRILASQDDALRISEDFLRRGKIVAMKGLGGFLMLVDARRRESVQRLRQLKHRDEKPFAVMAPDLQYLREICLVDEREESLLRSPAAPIVLLRRRKSSYSIVTNEVAPDNPYLGVMLPYTPLHHLLMADLGFIVVATSGNRSNEPICTDEQEALKSLGGIADVFLVHNRPIARHLDDSVANVVLGREMILRRARGYAPLPITLDRKLPPLIAYGSHLKNTTAVAVGKQVFISQHLCDLETEAALRTMRQTVLDLPKIFDCTPQRAVCDWHPDYLSTREAEMSGLPVVHIQHHLAHVFSCIAEHGISPPVLGVAWDGVGFGIDHTVWGGEFFIVDDHSCHRIAHLRQFPLPGSEKAVHEPRRSALGLLFQIMGDSVFTRKDIATIQAFKPEEINLLRQQLARQINCPQTSSAGRLFDALASLVGLQQICSFEGQAAMKVEFAQDEESTEGFYNYIVRESRENQSSVLRQPGTADATSLTVLRQPGTADATSLTVLRQPGTTDATTQSTKRYVLDWSMMIEEILDDLAEKIPLGQICAKFHQTLVEMILEIARRVGISQVVLSGGCWQNRTLLSKVVERLRGENFLPVWQQQIPTNDGGISLGQIAAVNFKDYHVSRNTWKNT